MEKVKLSMTAERAYILMSMGVVAVFKMVSGCSPSMNAGKSGS